MHRVNRTLQKAVAVAGLLALAYAVAAWPSESHTHVATGNDTIAFASAPSLGLDQTAASPDGPTPKKK